MIQDIVQRSRALIALAIAGEYRGRGIAANALWPATAIETQATIQHGLGNPQTWRKADILADATVALLQRDPNEATGQAWIDEELLRDCGVTDLVPYRCDPEVEPPKLDFKGIPPLSKSA